jgi:pimeloyl-ACP methyl ester carboxylesterase
MSRLPSSHTPAPHVRLQRIQVDPYQRVVVHDSGMTHAAPAAEPPLLLVHSVNATASTVEMESVLRRHAATRRVVMLDLPGFGESDKPDRRYTPQGMRDAIITAIDWIGDGPIDVMALSLACEFSAEAVLQRPAAVRSLALISPTGMQRRHADERYADGRTREQGWLRRLLRGTVVGRLLYRLLTTRASMRWFLSRMWGSPRFDPRLLEQGRRYAATPGAHHAPLDFVSGALFTRGVIERYRALPVPTWVCHGTRGAFTDFRACPDRTARFIVERTAFESGAMPHAEVAEAFDAAYARFLSHVALVNSAAVAAAIQPQTEPLRAVEPALRPEPSDA